MQKPEYIIRYLSLGKFIDLLTTQEIFLSRIDKFEDKTEGEWFAHLSKAANKSINEWQLRSNKSLQLVNNTLSNIPSPTFEDIVKTINSVLTEEQIQELDISDDITQVMDPEFFDSEEERIDFLKEVEESYLIDTMTEQEEKEYNIQRVKEIEELKKRAYVSSWFSSDSHSMAMWKLYGISEEGIAIKIKKDSLKNIKSINNELLSSLNAKILFNNVIYVNNHETEMGPLIDRKLNHQEWINFRDLLLKNTAYRYEEEYRVTLLLDKEDDNYKHGIKLKTGNLNNFIDSVILNPMISKNHWYRNVVCEVLSKFKIDEYKLETGEIKTDFTK
jgi:hypothetical protein